MLGKNKCTIGKFFLSFFSLFWEWGGFVIVITLGIFLSAVVMSNEYIYTAWSLFEMKIGALLCSVKM